MKRWILRIALSLMALVALALVCGATYEAIARRQRPSQLPFPGIMVDIGGRALHIDCPGTGSPTVVFESGLGSAGALDWSLVHDSVASTARACSYSRAGILASDPATTSAGPGRWHRSSCEGLDFKPGGYNDVHVGGRSFILMPSDDYARTTGYELVNGTAIRRFGIQGSTYHMVELRF